MTNRRYKPVQFGFLNTAQDSTDIGPAESPNATNLDPDELALGTLKHQQFSGEGTLRDFEETSFAGRRFFLGAPESYTSYSDGVWFRSGAPASISVKHDLTYAVVLRFRVSSDGFICGTRTFPTTEAQDGTFHFQVDSGALKYFCYDGSTYTSVTLDASIATDEWHDVVIQHTALAANAYLNGELKGSITIPPGVTTVPYAFGM